MPLCPLRRFSSRSWMMAGGGILLIVSLLVLGLESGQRLLQAKIGGGAHTTTTVTASQPASITVSVPLRVVGGTVDSPEVQAILALVSQLQAASNAHNADKLLSYYSKDFVSGDNLDLKQVRDLVQDTWSQYPDIQYRTDIQEVRLNGNWATVESLDHGIAKATNEAQLPGQTGQLTTESRSMLFLRRVGKSWVVESDYTVYETARILFGQAADLNVQLVAPDQVFSGESYTARLSLNIPAPYFAIAGITKEKLTFPHPATEDRFRTLSAENNRLERVFESNTANKNEIVTATIGLTQIGRDDKQRPTVAFKGIATIVKRVNVLPRPQQYKDGTPGATAAQVPLAGPISEEVVHQSADGRINATPEAPAASPVEAGPVLENAPTSTPATPPVKKD